MLDIAAQVDALGGIAQKKQLVARGARDLDLTRAVRDRDVRRARQGWYITLPESDPRVRAVRVGGRLTGLAAIAAMGGWVLDDPPLHVSIPVNAARLRSQWNRHDRLGRRDRGGVVLHWEGDDLLARGSVHTVALTDALLRAVLDEPLERAIAAIDWALSTDRIDDVDLARLTRALPETFAELADWVDGDCDSLPESLARTRLRIRGHVVASQRQLPTGERVDLVIDECVALETDGERFHQHRFEADRRKDLTITIEKLHCIRVSARVVFREWQLAERAIESALAQHSRLSRSITPHGVVARFGNSGLRTRAGAFPPGFTRERRRERRRSPEFPKGGERRNAQKGMSARLRSSGSRE